MGFVKDLGFPVSKGIKAQSRQASGCHLEEVEFLSWEAELLSQRKGRESCAEGISGATGKGSP